MDTTTELQQIRQELDELRRLYKKLAERLIPEDEATPEEENARIRERLRKAAAETDALRTTSSPRYDTTKEIRKHRERR